MTHETNSRNPSASKIPALLLGFFLPCLAAANGFAGSAAGTADQTWYVREFNHSTQECQGTAYRIQFVNDTLALCATSCNTLMFRYDTDGPALAFAFRGSTVRYCPVSREFEFMNTLTRVQRKIVSGHSILLLDDSDTLIVCTDIPLSPLEGITWIPEELNRSGDNLKGYLLKFINDTNVTARLHCNRCFFPYKLRADSIAFAAGACTEIACIDPNREQEFGETMRQVRTWTRSEFRLFFMDGRDTLMRCVDSAVFALLGQPWLLRSFQKDSTRTVIDTPEKYTLTFLPDGLVRVVSDCNTCNGSFTASDGIAQLAVKQLACTKVNCGPSSHDITYSWLAGSIGGCVLRSDTLMCISLSGSILIFTRATTSAIPHTAPGSAEKPDAGISIARRGTTLMIRSKYGSLSEILLYNARGVCVRRTEGKPSVRAVVSTENLPDGAYIVVAGAKNGVRQAQCVHIFNHIRPK